ncbi:hypothetical protein C8Q72DRAFT_781241 [Fomitopsis betulina]|nr:hypothetical protein C8Q72DRAFT_781241 [Fomitopsis betulina]
MATLIGRQGPLIPVSCADLPYGSFGSPSYNFTLSATTADGTSTPLVFALGPPGTSPAASEWVIAVSDAPDSTDWPYYSMAQGYLRPQPGPNEQGLAAYGNPVDQGDVLSFTVTVQESSPTEAEIYCDANESQQYRELSVNNNIDGFSLCTTQDYYYSDEVVLVYEAQASNSDYLYDTCEAVTVYLVPVTA